MTIEDNTAIQLLQQSFRITIGAATSFVETLQDPQKRSEQLSELQEQWNQRSQEWSAKGEMTEQEARRMVEGWLARQRNPQTTTTSEDDSVDDSSVTPTEASPSTNVQTEIKDLTEQLTALRSEIEKLRRSKN